MHRAVGRSTRRERKAVTFPSLSLSPSQEKVGVNGRVRKGKRRGVKKERERERERERKIL